MYGQQNWVKRSEVEVILDGRNNAFDSVAWYYHKMNQGRHGGGRGCGCGGTGCQQCWSPATAWFDYNRVAVSYMKDIWDCLYGRNNHCGPSWCPPAYADPCAPPCGPERAGKMFASVSLRQGGTVVVTFKVFNPTCDVVKLQVAVDGFWDASHQHQWVGVRATELSDLAPGETRTIHVSVNALDAHLPPQIFEGTIRVQTPFVKLIALEVQVTE